MTFRRRAIALLALLALLAWAPSASSADESRELRSPTIRPDALDLLPFSAFELQDFRKEHGTLLYRARTVRQRVGKLRGEHARLAGKKDGAKRRTAIQKELRRLTPQLAALMARVTGEILDTGVEGALIAYMNRAPKGKARLQRYSHGLVLLLDDLTPEQSLLFHTVLSQMEGAYQVLDAQQERTVLALKQTELEPSKVRAVSGTFDRQRTLIDKRFWILVDTTLDEEQKYWLWNQLPQTMRRKSQAQEHLYTLAGITGSQGLRLKSLATEIEHESSPDQAAVRRINAQLAARDRKLPAKEREALQKERGAAYGRLNELNRFRDRETRKILTEAQWREYQSIPPRISTNERSGNYRRVLQGWKPSAKQQAKITELQKAVRTAARESRKQMALAQREGADYGPDSPQMMSMQMAMSEAKAGQAAASRALIGTIFTEVMRVEEVGQWVLGHWGYKQ